MYRILMLVLCPMAVFLGVLVLLRQPEGVPYERVPHMIIGAIFAFGWPTVNERLTGKVKKMPLAKTVSLQTGAHRSTGDRTRKRRSPHPRDILLRPAQGNPETLQEQLLRPVEK